MCYICDNPVSLSLAGLTIWPNWLERWLATLQSVLPTQVRNPVGLLVPGRYILFRQILVIGPVT